MWKKKQNHILLFPAKLYSSSLKNLALKWNLNHSLYSEYLALLINDFADYWPMTIHHTQGNYFPPDLLSCAIFGNVVRKGVNPGRDPYCSRDETQRLTNHSTLLGIHYLLSDEMEVYQYNYNYSLRVSFWWSVERILYSVSWLQGQFLIHYQPVGGIGQGGQLQDEWNL